MRSELTIDYQLAESSFFVLGLINGIAELGKAVFHEQTPRQIHTVLSVKSK